MKKMNHKPLSEEERQTILAGDHYWPEGSPRPYTLEEILQTTVSCEGADVKRFELIKAEGMSAGTLFDRKTGRNVLRRDAPVAQSQKKKSLRRAPVVSRGGAMMSKAMQAASLETVVHARHTD